MPVNNQKDNLKNRAKKPIEITFNSAILRNLVVGVFVISIIIGGASGLLFSAWANADSSVTDWISRNIFGTTSAQTQEVSQPRVAGSKSIRVEESSATIDAVKKASPAVVNIIVTQDLSEIYNSTGPDVFDRFDFNFPFEFETPEGKQEIGAGTGFIISEDGMILTNKHVVDADGAEYTVVMNDGQQYEAHVLDTDPFNDIALMKIDASGLTKVEIGDSDTLAIGQTVIAIGNTLGEYSNTVTRGVVSGLARTVTAGDGAGQSETLEGIIQTDAAINMGNSGGPLINLAGQVVGVNTAINREGQLIGFAIPINQANIAIESVQEYGRIVRPYLGVRYILLNEEIAAANNLAVDYGALIVRGDTPTEFAVIPGSPADIAGLVENNIILEVNGQRIDSGHSLAKQLQLYNPGDSVSLKVMVKGEQADIIATLAEIDD